jgi:hypothetical protein
MAFRFRRSVRLGPLRFNFGKAGLSSIAVGGRGASFNIPVARSGGPRTTVGLPGTGLSWSVEQTPDRSVAIPAGAAQGLPNSRRLRPGQLESLKAELLAVIETPEAMQAYLLRAQSQDDAKRRAQCCIEAVQEAVRLAAGRGWLS